MTTLDPLPRTAEVRAQRGRPIAVTRAGVLDYLSAWELQKRLVARRQRGELPDVLLLLEHQPVYTLGKRTDPEHLLLDDDARAERGIDLVRVDRGGDVPYHGPGQLVGDPILQLATLRSVVDYVRTLEEILIRSLASFGVAGRRDPGFTGVWVDERKVAAIGVRVASGGVTSHGFALNVDPRMRDFEGIVPCGIADRGVCSLAQLGVTADVDEAAERVVAAAAEVLDATLEDVHIDDLDTDRRPAV